MCFRFSPAMYTGIGWNEYIYIFLTMLHFVYRCHNAKKEIPLEGNICRAEQPLGLKWELGWSKCINSLFVGQSGWVEKQGQAQESTVVIFSLGNKIIIIISICLCLMQPRPLKQHFPPAGIWWWYSRLCVKLSGCLQTCFSHHCM